MILVTGTSGLIGRAALPMLMGLDECLPFVLSQECVGEVPSYLLDDAPWTGLVHLGAMARQGECEGNPERAWLANVETTRKLWELARQHGAWMVFASSREVYGDSQPDQAAFDTSSPYAPKGVYARSKVAAECACHGATIVRFSNVFGGLGDHRTRFVPAVMRAALEGSSLHVDGNGDSAYDFVHLNAAVELLKAVVITQLRKEGPGVYQCSTGRTTSLAEIVSIVSKLAGEPIPMHFGPLRTYGAQRTRLVQTMRGWGERLEHHLKSYYELLQNTAPEKRWRPNNG